MKPRSWEPERWFVEWRYVEDGVIGRQKHARGWDHERYPATELFLCVGCRSLHGIRRRSIEGPYEIRQQRLCAVADMRPRCLKCAGKELKHANRLRSVLETRKHIKTAMEVLRNGGRENNETHRHHG